MAQLDVIVILPPVSHVIVQGTVRPPQQNKPQPKSIHHPGNHFRLTYSRLVRIRGWWISPPSPPVSTSGNPGGRIDTCSNRKSQHSRNYHYNNSCRPWTRLSLVQLCSCSRYERNFHPPFPSPPFHIELLIILSKSLCSI